MKPITVVEDTDDLEITGRILDVLRTSGLPESCWDNAVEHILTGSGWEDW